MSFTDLIDGARRTDTGFALDIPETWHQGRTAYGGFSASLALAASRMLADDLPPLRSAQISYVGPLFGTAEVSARMLRRGRNASWVNAEIANEKGVGLTATFVFMGPVQSALAFNDSAPPDDVIACDEASVFDNPHAPQFIANNFEQKFAVPRTEAKQPRVTWWARQKNPGRMDPMADVLMCADALPPGVMPMLGRGVPVSTMQWQVNLLTAEPRTRDGWWLLQAEADYAENGCSSQRMMIWNADGEPIAAGKQSVAVFG